MGTPRIAVIGIGEDGIAGLGPRGRAHLDSAELLVGGARHLGFLGPDPRRRLVWASPLELTIEALQESPERQIAVLATGDPSWYGIAARLRRAFGAEAITVIPGISTFQLACARLGWALDEIEPVTVHGRPLTGIGRFLQRGRRLVVLTGGAEGPHHLSGLVTQAGFAAAPFTVLERLGGPAELLSTGTAGTPPPGPFDPLNCVAIDLASATLPGGLSLVPGRPEDAFDHDGQITKPEVRAVTLARLAPLPGELLWDVGAGAGSVAIEWLRAEKRVRAIAVERDALRSSRIRANAERMGVPELQVITGAAPACLTGLSPPDAVFVGGGIAQPGLLEACLAPLRPGGRLVANAVTVEGEAALLAFARARGGSLTRLAVARAEPVGGHLAWRPAMPVTQLALTKPLAEPLSAP